MLAVPGIQSGLRLWFCANEDVRETVTGGETQLSRPEGEEHHVKIVTSVNAQGLCSLALCLGLSSTAYLLGQRNYWAIHRQAKFKMK